MHKPSKREIKYVPVLYLMLVKGLTSRLCCSGSDSVRIRSSRAAAVCLLLLCVLLLTAVIVPATRNNNLTEERDQLLTKNKNLTGERDQDWDELILNLSSQMDGWIYHEFSYYYISSGWKSWTESRIYCTDRGGDLIIKDNSEEQEFDNISGGADVWIGLTDSDVEDRWKWVDGKPNGQRGENCALNNPSRSADYPHNNAFKWVCEESVLPTLLP
uniref:C-type lectin domain-containing protein n=1 Tax=Sinocyclocheilus anshuiensis TaxID=1608454 RepID=A0A671L328_9TELE